MAITKLHLKEFGAFEDARFEFSPGINVFLGTNATGKSHAMKALYAPLKTLEQQGTTIPLESRLHEKLARVFRPDDGYMGRLVRRRVGQGKGYIEIGGTSGEISIVLNTKGKQPIDIKSATWRAEAPCIFLPTREVLAMYEGFVPAYLDRELSFDETTFDVCLALGRAPLRGPRQARAKTIFEPIEAALGGKVVLRGNRFYLVRPDGDMEAHLVAEGFRKLGSLAYLARNGSLMENGLLFWDEPEANLNPQLVSLVVDLLIELGKQGVQIFVTTHDYLLSHKLSLIAEYAKQPQVPIRFFSFHRKNVHGPVLVAPGEVLADLPENPILDEFTRHYDFERSLFDEGLPRKDSA
jgi:hypothetical protein